MISVSEKILPAYSVGQKLPVEEPFWRRSVRENRKQVAGRQAHLALRLLF
jgi:hypothetical protein